MRCRLTTLLPCCLSQELLAAVTMFSGDDNNSPDTEFHFTRRIKCPHPGDKYAFDYDRPLEQKVEMLLDLMFRRLFWDPMEPEQVYTPEKLKKLVMKIDKDLGP